MNDPVLGPLTRDQRLDWLESEPKAIAFLGGKPCRFVLQDYDPEDVRADEIRQAVLNVLRAGGEVLRSAQPYVAQYCRETLARFPDESAPNVRLRKPSDVWSHVEFGSQLHVHRRADGDAEDGVYVSLECSCEWEIEHGMQLVLRDGRAITKVGPFDGHLTNADAYADPNLVGVVYVPLG